MALVPNVDYLFNNFCHGPNLAERKILYFPHNGNIGSLPDVFLPLAPSLTQKQEFALWVKESGSTVFNGVYEGDLRRKVLIIIARINPGVADILLRCINLDWFNPPLSEEEVKAFFKEKASFGSALNKPAALLFNTLLLRG